MPSPLVCLVKCYPAAIRREAGVGVLAGGTGDCDLLSVAIEPYELRPEGPRSGLHQQSLIAGYAKKSQIDLRKILDLIVDDSGFAAQREIASVEFLGHQGAVAQVYQVAGFDVGGIRARLRHQPLLAGI